jgi:hypothetical protein
VDSLESPTGVVLPIPNSGVLAVGETYLSEPMFIPSYAIRLSLEVRAARVTSVAPTLTVKLRQGNTEAATLVDRGVASPAALAAIGATGAAVLLTDDVVSCWYQVEIACTVAPCQVTAVAGAR